MSKGDRTFRNLFFALIAAGLLGVIFILWKANQPQQTDLLQNDLVQPSPTSMSCFTSQEAFSHIGETGCVDYYVGDPFRSSAGNVFLNERRDYQNGFSAVIFANDVGNFSTDPISNYGYKNIEVTGTIQSYQGHPEIIVSQESQITSSN